MVSSLFGGFSRENGRFSGPGTDPGRTPGTTGLAHRLLTATGFGTGEAQCLFQFTCLFLGLGTLAPAFLMMRESGAGRDQAADDHVFLQATQPVDLAGDGRLGEYPRGLLERRRRDERLGRKRSLGDAQ